MSVETTKGWFPSHPLTVSLVVGAGVLLSWLGTGFWTTLGAAVLAGGLGLYLDQQRKP